MWAEGRRGRVVGTASRTLPRVPATFHAPPELTCVVYASGTAWLFPQPAAPHEAGNNFKTTSDIDHLLLHAIYFSFYIYNSFFLVRKIPHLTHNHKQSVMTSICQGNIHLRCFKVFDISL